jgi:hypothetical protein
MASTVGGAARLCLGVCCIGLGLGACQLQGDCVSIGRPSHKITVLDSTSRRVVAAGARVVVIGGGQLDTVVLRDNQPNAVVAMERDGPVSLLVSQTGYRDWRRDNVLARRTSHCNVVEAVTVTALLQRLE